MNDDPRLRLFVAVSIPDEHLEWLRDATGSLRERWPRARWANPKNQHVTLKFLGSTPSDRLLALVDALGIVARSHEGADVSLGGLGSFPSRRRIRVLWAGLEDSTGLLEKLAGDINRALEPLGYVTEDRPFRAHLTLARFREPQRASEPLPELDPSRLPSVSIDSFELFRSHLSPKGARYEVLESFALGGGPKDPRTGE